MSKVITVLEKMASDALINNDKSIDDLVASIGINNVQQQAIKNNDSETLVQNSGGFPEIKCFALLPAEDDEEPKEESETDDSEKAIAVNS